jgi:peptide/nickel transport system permease protein
MGLNEPLLAQFFHWLTGLVRLDMGTSMWTGRPVTVEIAERLPTTIEVAVQAVIIGVIIALPLGILASIRRGTALDHGVRLFTVLGISLPGFWVGMLVQTLLLISFGWLPPVMGVSLWSDPWGHITQIGLPALVVGWRMSAVLTRMLRSSMLEVLEEDYVRTAKAKGVPKWGMILGHALRNATLPTITVLGLDFAFLLSGMVVTEQVFNLNGVGKLLVQAVSQRDYTLIQGLVMMFAVSFVTINLVIDMLYAVLDPRVRSQR